MLNKLKVEELIEKTKSSSPNPGGGGISSIVGALGASLSIMAYNISKGKKSYKDLDKNILEEIDKSIENIDRSINELEIYLTKDGNAFQGVLDALRLPKDDESRKSKLEEGYKEASRSPFIIANLLLEILKNQEILSKYMDKTAISDVAISIIISYAALDSVLYNVSINLHGLKEEDRSLAEKEMEKLRKESKELMDKNLSLIEKRM